MIPNGDGHWMKTDPRFDQERTGQINQAHDGHVLKMIRLMKYWNRRPTMPSIPSYVLECLVLNYYEASATSASQFVDLEFIPILQHLAAGVLGTISDPKGIQGNLNSLPWADRIAIATRANSDIARASAARLGEQRGDHMESIRYWGVIFGPNFPTFG